MYLCYSWQPFNLSGAQQDTPAMHKPSQAPAYLQRAPGFSVLCGTIRLLGLQEDTDQHSHCPAPSRDETGHQQPPQQLSVKHLYVPAVSLDPPPLHHWVRKRQHRTPEHKGEALNSSCSHFTAAQALNTALLVEVKETAFAPGLHQGSVLPQAPLQLRLLQKEASPASSHSLFQAAYQLPVYLDLELPFPDHITLMAQSPCDQT
ncbi:uncharacterized protein LOC136018886 [Lathamus discolor]|uniref:uncharacterized protein LOC136018886 n=1 Tax=Lathamus discolor TaxID=678569 RepID=UPI0032B7CA15